MRPGSHGGSPRLRCSVGGSSRKLLDLAFFLSHRDLLVSDGNNEKSVREGEKEEGSQTESVIQRLSPHTHTHTQVCQIRKVTKQFALPSHWPFNHHLPGNVAKHLPLSLAASPLRIYESVRLDSRRANYTAELHHAYY